jgi:hypothetical protein
LSETVENELSTLGARDAVVLAAICVPPERLRAPGHRLCHAFLLRLIGARHTMKRLEQRGYLEPGWSVDYQGAHCQLTELGTGVARAAAIVLNLAPNEGSLSNVGIIVQVVLNRKLDV